MLTPGEEKLLMFYKKQLDKPKLKYILNRGFLFGFLMIFFTLLIQFVFQKKTLEQQWEQGLPARIIIYFLVGIAYGWYARRIMEKQYRRLKEKDELR